MSLPSKLSSANKPAMVIPTTCRAYHIAQPGSFEGLEIKEVNVPQPKPNEVLLKAHAVSLQFRDLMVAKGTYGPPTRPGLIPCSDVAGSIIAVGSDVKGFKIGDRVSPNFMLDFIAGEADIAIQGSSLGGPINGTLVEYRTYPAHSLVHIPDHLSWEEASTLPCAAVTAYNALLGPHPLKGGDTVLVLGTGGVSTWALLLAVASGATVIVTSSSNSKLEAAKKLGAKHVINYKETPTWDEEVIKLTGGRGVDHVVEVGGPGTLAKSLRAVRFSGNVHIIGQVSQVKEDVNIPFMTIRKALTIHGVYIGSVASFNSLNRLIFSAQIRPVIDKVFEFEQVKEAYEYMAGQSHMGKIVVKVCNE